MLLQASAGIKRDSCSSALLVPWYKRSTGIRGWPYTRQAAHAVAGFSRHQEGQLQQCFAHPLVSEVTLLTDRGPWLSVVPGKRKGTCRG